MYWIVQKEYKDILKYNPNIDGILEVDNLSESSKLVSQFDAAQGEILIDMHYDNLDMLHRNPINPMINEHTYLKYGTLLEVFCLCAGLPKIHDAPFFYLDKSVSLPSNLPKNYIVIHCTSQWLIKNWSARKWNKLAKCLVKRGFTLVEIGTKPIVKSKNPAYYDFTTEHDLQVIAKIISEATYFIGVDSGFAHIANCFGIKSVLIFGMLHEFAEYQVYTGNFANGDIAKIVRKKNRGACFVKVKDVIKAFHRLEIL